MMTKTGTTILFGMTCWLALACNDLSAQESKSLSKVGTTAAQFLKFGAGARSIAMGSAFSAVSDDINAIYWNPAGLSRIPGSGEATFNHSEWLAETNYDFAAFTLNLPNFGTLGFQTVFFGTPDEPVRTVNSPSGTGQVWNATSIALGLSYARSLTDRFAIGFTGKFIQEKVFNETARGAAFDLGVLYHTPFKSLRLGAAITNFGTKMKLQGRDIFFNEDPLTEQGSVDQVPAEYRLASYEIPLNLRFGLAYDVIRNDNISIVAAADGAHPNDNTEFLNGGAELGLRKILYLRGGYKALFLRDSEQGLTLGFGLRYDTPGLNLKLDYAWADYGRLDNVQFVSFTIRY